MSDASNALSISPKETVTPPGLTDENREEIRTAIVRQAVATTREQLDRNRDMIRSARHRFLASRNCAELQELETGSESPERCRDLVTRASVPFDIDGFARATRGGAITSGTFFGQNASVDGTRRQLISGHFDISYDSDIGTRVTVDGRLAWERQMNSRTLLSYFVAGDLARSDVGGGYSGNADHARISAGGKFVHQLNGGVLSEGFASIGYAVTGLEMSNGTLAVDSGYHGRFLNTGLTLVPQVSFSYGYTRIGTVEFDAQAVGFSTSEALDTGHVSLGSIEFAPEFVFPVAVATDDFDSGFFSLQPMLTCQHLETERAYQSCGGGVALEVSAASDDGARSMHARLEADRIRSATRSRLSLGFDLAF